LANRQQQQVKLQLNNKIIGPAKKFKNQPRHFFRTRSIHTCQKKPNISRETLSLRYC